MTLYTENFLNLVNILTIQKNQIKKSGKMMFSNVSFMSCILHIFNETDLT